MRCVLHFFLGERFCGVLLGVFEENVFLGWYFRGEFVVVCVVNVVV
jgi:hypothetical protein